MEFVMLGGTGPSARAGYPVFDCPERVRNDIIKGITVILNPAQVKIATDFYAGNKAAKPGSGIEVE